MMLALNAGLLLPLLIGFTDIVLRAALEGNMASSGILAVSFSVQFMGYLIGYFYLWKWLLASYTFKAPKALLSQATAALFIITLLFYVFLFRIDNMLSNMIWLLFYALVVFSFYLIGQRAIRSGQNR